MNNKFVNDYLTDVKWNKEIEWLVSGIINKKSNQYYKFDIRNLSDFIDKKGKLISSKNKSDKVLFEDDQNWILVDTQELIKYMKDHSLKEVKLEELISKLEWNILLPKK
jgi:hypothetical protein